MVDIRLQNEYQSTGWGRKRGKNFEEAWVA